MSPWTTRQRRSDQPQRSVAAGWRGVGAALAGLLLTAVFVFSAFRPAAAAPAVQDFPPDARAGLDIYDQKCAPCHGFSGLGNGPLAAQLAAPPTQFADAAVVWDIAPASLFSVTQQGRIERFMPPFGESLSDQDIWNVVAYLWALHRDAAEAQQGATVYAASCAGCHGDAGRGDGPNAASPMPDLTSLTETAGRSQRAWFDALQAPAHSASADLSDADRWAALEFIRTWTLAPPKPRTYTPGSGQLSGVVANDTPQGGATSGLSVTLSIFDQFELVNEITTTTSVSGLYRFDGLNTDPSWFYLARLRYAGVPYSSGVVTLTQEQPAAQIPISVWETTTDASVLAVERVHWFIEFDQSNVLLAELYIWSNDSDRVFIGATSSDVRGVLPFDLPSGYQGLSFDDGEIGARYRLTASGVVDTLPMPPGQGARQTLLRYVLPMSSSEMTIAHPVPVLARSLNVLVADVGAAVSSPDLQEGPPRDVDQGRYFNFTASNVPAGQVVAIRLTNLPLNRPPTGAAASEANSPWLAAGAAAFAALALLGVLAYLLRQRQTAAEADMDAQGEEDGESDDDYDDDMDAEEAPTSASLQRQRLIAAIADLDDRRDAGEVSDADYTAARARLKAELLQVVQAQFAAQDAAEVHGP